MTVTEIIPRPGWRARMGLALGLARAATFYATNGRAPLPGVDGQVVLAIRVPQPPCGSRLDALAEIAERLETTEEPAPLDCTIAERRFGCVHIVASVRGPGYFAEFAGLAAVAETTRSAA